MTELRKRMIEDMRLAGHSQGTQDAYIRVVRQLAKHFHISPDRLSERQLRNYLMHLRDANVAFVIEPYVRFEGETGEQWTMFLLDPAGNALEFKAFADDSQEHLLGVHGGNRQCESFADPQATCVDQGKTTAVDWVSDRGDQATAVLIASNVGEALAIGLAHFFLVSSGQS